jgi:hypothetical protein
MKRRAGRVEEPRGKRKESRGAEEEKRELRAGHQKGKRREGELRIRGGMEEKVELSKKMKLGE